MYLFTQKLCLHKKYTPCGPHILKYTSLLIIVKSYIRVLLFNSSKVFLQPHMVKVGLPRELNILCNILTFWWHVPGNTAYLKTTYLSLTESICAANIQKDGIPKQNLELGVEEKVDGKLGNDIEMNTTGKQLHRYSSYQSRNPLQMIKVT